MSGFVERARNAGARAVWGGRKHEAGDLFFEPTLFEGVARDSELFRKEVFGPVLSWHTFESDDEAVELANDQEYGLAATLFSRGGERARSVAERIVAGTLWVNCYFIRELEAPFGGTRNSGIGREGGIWSFDFFCDVKNVAIRKDSFNTNS